MKFVESTTRAVVKAPKSVTTLVFVVTVGLTGLLE
jgi:hypothetical protein